MLIEKELSQITKINYFSDGEAGQYKNHKYFTNLLDHADDFNISSWLIFLCHITWQECMWWHWSRNQVSSCIQQSTKSNNWSYLNSSKTFEFWIQNITGKIFFVSTEEVRSYGPMLFEWFKNNRTLPGTHSHHCFCISQVTNISFPEFLVMKSLSLSIWEVACFYEKDWFVGIIINISIENQDAWVKFMHPKGPSVLFKWPLRDYPDSIWTNFENIESFNYSFWLHFLFWQTVAIICSVSIFYIILKFVWFHFHLWV